jgi:hypothetical protein
MVDRDYVQAAGPESLERWSDLCFQHGKISGNGSVLVGAKKSCPGVEPHAGIDSGSHFLNREIIAANSDLAHCTVLLALVSNDLRDSAVSRVLFAVVPPED